ncbi:D-aminoacyl-tRNA deacylase [soil metagenome]
MIGLLQRVTSATVAVETEVVADIGTGLLVLVGVERGDGDSQAARLAERLLNFRVFADDAGRMNRSLAEQGGSLLLVPQFTLAADTQKGTRAGFSRAATPEEGARLFDVLTHHAQRLCSRVQTGRFGAHMQVTLVNDGPVTFWLRADPRG